MPGRRHPPSCQPLSTNSTVSRVSQLPSSAKGKPHPEQLRGASVGVGRRDARQGLSAPRPGSSYTRCATPPASKLRCRPNTPCGADLRQPDRQKAGIPLRNGFSRLPSRCHSITCPCAPHRSSVRSAISQPISSGRVLASFIIPWKRAMNIWSLWRTGIGRINLPVPRSHWSRDWKPPGTSFRMP